jgi:four helix bundle protein
MDKGKRKSHRDLIVWQKALELAKVIHVTILGFPKHELFGLTPQLRRASVSIASNIAEGAARASTKEFLHFIHIARGSHAEAETQLLLAVNIGYLADLKAVQRHLEEVGKLINAVISGLKRREQHRLHRPSALSPTP